MRTLYLVTTSVACLIAYQPVVPVFRQNFMHATYKTNMPEILTSTAVALFWIGVIKVTGILSQTYLTNERCDTLA